MINQSLRDQLIDAYLALIPLVTLNVVWFVVSLPIVTAPPAAGALIYATNRIANGKPAGISVFFEGFRLHFWRSWAWGLVNIVVAVVLVSNYLFYGQLDESLSIWARGFVLTLAFLWVAVQMYTFPLMLEQEKPRLRTALRNSLVVMLKRPFYSMGIALVIIVVVVVSSLFILPLWGFVTASVCAYLANRAAVTAVARFGRKSAPVSPEAAEDAGSEL